MLKRALYLGAVGIVTETMQLHVMFNVELLKMTESSAHAVLMQAKAAESQAVSEELQVQADKDKAEATALEGEATLLEEKSTSDAAAAATGEASATELGEIAAEKEGEAATHFAKAALEEAISKEELAAGTEVAEVAVETSMEAHVDEAAVVLCQIVPGLDVICDFVGGLAATTLDTAAAAEASEAIADFVAATATKEQEQAEIAFTTDLQAQATAEAAEAGAAQEEAMALTEKAETEELEAEADEAAAVEDFARSVAEADAATGEEVEATEEEAQAEKALQDSIRHGIQAIGFVLAQVGLALVTMSFFSIRLVVSFLVPTLFSPPEYSLLLSASTVMHSVGMFVLVAVTLDGQIIQKQMNTQSRGGTIVEISLASLVLQALLLHLVHTTYGPQNNPFGWLRRVVRLLLDLFLLFGWNVLGCFVLSSSIAAIPFWVVCYVIGPILLVTLLLHHWCRYKYLERVSSKQLDVESQHETTVVSEKTSLLGKKKDTSVQERHLLESHHHLLFDLLITSVLATLVWSCLTRTAILRPFWSPAKEALGAVVVHYKCQLGIASGCALVIAAVVCARGRFRGA
jgi:hypothetical protein